MIDMLSVGYSYAKKEMIEILNLACAIACTRSFRGLKLLANREVRLRLRIVHFWDTQCAVRRCTWSTVRWDARWARSTVLWGTLGSSTVEHSALGLSVPKWVHSSIK